MKSRGPYLRSRTPRVGTACTEPASPVKETMAPIITYIENVVSFSNKLSSVLCYLKYF